MLPCVAVCHLDGHSGYCLAASYVVPAVGLPDNITHDAVVQKYIQSAIRQAEVAHLVLPDAAQRNRLKTTFLI